MSKTLIIELTPELVNYIQRLGNEVDNKIFIIDYIFTKHSQDKDISLFNLARFQNYLQKYEQAMFEWTQAKIELQKNYIDPQIKKITGLNNLKYNWQISDFLSLQCEVTLL